MKISFLAFVLFHASVPVLCVAMYGASPFWIVGSLVFSITVIRTVQRSNTSTMKSILGLASGFSMFLSLMLGVSYYMQGTGFNDQYFYHLDAATMVVAAKAYGGVFYPSLLILIVAFFAPAVLYRQVDSDRPGRLPVALLWLATAVTIFPVYSLLNYWAGVKDEMSDMMPQLPSDTGRTASTGKVSGQPGPQPAETAQQVETGNQLKKNIIIIYAEGFEQLYFDQEIFGDIVPNLRKLSGQAYRFTNAYQVRGATWTIAGIVASQCGFPLVVSNHIASNSTMASIDKPFENEECLADILLENGYKTVFMGGDPNSFAGRGNFLRTHGYQEVLGYGELIPLLADQDYTMGWGLYDDSLFGLAYEKLETLEAGDSPYLLVLSTLDTHHPEGHPSKSCQRLSDNDDPISNAVYCSDQLISKFIKSIMELADMDETVIVLFSDHLAMRNSLWAKLRANKGQRRLTWMMFDNQPAGRSNRVATHFDFAPTLLDKSGISGYSTINQGVSLLTQQDSRADGAPPEVDIAQAPRPLGSDYSVRKSGFRINYSDLTIIVGDLSLKASENGWRFTSGLYLVVFDEEGNVIDTIHSVDFARLVKELNGRFVVGISIHEKGSEHDNQFFFGRVTNDLTGLSVRKLDSDVTVDASQLNF